MTNNNVGTVYQQVIADVVESSRVDFEEGGVDERVLEELRLGWQNKLSQLGVATFPWDPKVEPQAPISNPPTVPSNAGNYQPIPAMNQPQGGLSMPQISNGPHIKAEPGLESPMSSMQPSPYQPQMATATTAQQRAAAHLQENYGSRAAASINAIHGGVRQQPQLQPNAGQQPSMQQMQQMQQRAAQISHMQQQQQAQGMQQGQRPQMTQEQYRQMMAATAARNLQQTQNNQTGLQGAQTDGAGDEEVEALSVIKRYDSNGNETSMGRIEIDNLIRSKIESMGQTMEGGGLMLPLRHASTPSSRQSKSQKKGKGRAQVDGGDDDEDDKDGVKHEDFDEDAINSDLDDPDEGDNEEEDDDEGMGHIMLCMYDKVQRVKNKWKCVMKDGVLTVNGREYVFHKASGEYEW